MNNREIIKSYEQLCSTLRVNSSEEMKQQFLILFKELEIQLNKSFDENMEILSYTSKSLREEMRRIDNILSLIKSRKEFRNNMINDHRKYIGYDPLDLKEIKVFDEIENYKAYKNNLKIAFEIITGLIKSDRKLKALRSQIGRNPKNANYLQKEIDRIIELRTNQIEDLKTKTEVMDDLYNYGLTAPFNEENAYINYLLIKLNSKNKIKIDLSRDNKRVIVSRTKKEEKPKKDTIPESASLGSVKPNNMVNKLNGAPKRKKDINIPTNGLTHDDEIIKIDVKEI